MMLSILKWIRILYHKTITSIAFVPAITALTFLILSFLLIELDFSETGKALKSNQKWLRLKDADTARSIISAIVAGIISLTVFSFSMVMILLSQVASQLSNRVLDKLIGNRFQQTVLGFYIGTIVYALFLLSTIRDIDSGVNIPSLSTYLLITFTIIDIFLFIYFLHYITRSVIYDTIIHKIHDNTKKSLIKNCTLKTSPIQSKIQISGKTINAYKSGIFQGIEQEEFLKFCVKLDIVIEFVHPVGTFILEDNPILIVNYKQPLPDDFEKDLSLIINIFRGQEINTSSHYGFKQLMEIAIKALSPGINDPGTAVLCLQALADLLALRLEHYPQSEIKDENDVLRITHYEMSFKELFEVSFFPIWDYGKEDRLIQNEMNHILNQLKAKKDNPEINKLLEVVKRKIYSNT